jgi:hypothetical protein
MRVQMSTDANIAGRESLASAVEAVVIDAAAHHRPRIGRVEVHLADENGPKGGPNDRRCTMEARVDGLGPVVVTFHASSLKEAIDGAGARLRHALDSTFDKHDDRGAARVAGRFSP